MTFKLFHIVSQSVFMDDITEWDGQFCFTSQQKDEDLQCKAQAREREKNFLASVLLS